MTCCQPFFLCGDLCQKYWILFGWPSFLDGARSYAALFWFQALVAELLLCSLLFYIHVFYLLIPNDPRAQTQRLYYFNHTHRMCQSHKTRTSWILLWWEIITYSNSKSSESRWKTTSKRVGASIASPCMSLPIHHPNTKDSKYEWTQNLIGQATGRRRALEKGGLFSLES